MGRRNGFGLLGRVTRDLGRFRELSWSDRWLLFQTEPVVLLMALGLRLRGYRRLRELLERTAPIGDETHEPATNGAGSMERALRAADVVDIALRRGPVSGTCLERSLTLWWLLRRRGVATDLRFGVRRADEFEAHAWVELDGVVLNDRSMPGENFAPIDPMTR